MGQDVSLVQRLDADRVLIAVFDGHGKNGLEVAVQTKEMVQQSVGMLAAAVAEGDLAGAFVRLFRQLQQHFEGREIAQNSGTTVTAALVDPIAQTVRCAHVGDSAAVVASGTSLEFATEDHDFNQDDMNRIAACGGEVRETQTAMKTVRRVYCKGQNYPALALARSLGDTDAHKWGVLADPSVSDAIGLGAGHLLILASDGVWNVMQKDDVLHEATVGSAEEAAHRVANAARRAWPQSGTDYIDDISVVVVKVAPLMLDESQLGLQAMPLSETVAARPKAPQQAEGKSTPGFPPAGPNLAYALGTHVLLPSDLTSPMPSTPSAARGSGPAAEARVDPLARTWGMTTQHRPGSSFIFPTAGNVRTPSPTGVPGVPPTATLGPPGPGAIMGGIPAPVGQNTTRAASGGMTKLGYPRAPVATSMSGEPPLASGRRRNGAVAAPPPPQHLQRTSPGFGLAAPPTPLPTAPLQTPSQTDATQQRAYTPVNHGYA